MSLSVWLSAPPPPIEGVKKRTFLRRVTRSSLSSRPSIPPLSTRVFSNLTKSLRRSVDTRKAAEAPGLGRAIVVPRCVRVLGVRHGPAQDGGTFGRHRTFSGPVRGGGARV